MYANGYYEQGRTRKYHSRNDGIRHPDESWVVGGDSSVEASVWIARGANEGQEFLDLRRVVEKDGELKKLKTFRKSDLADFYLGLAEHAARISEDESLSDDERDYFAQLSEGTVELLEKTPPVERKKRKPRRKNRSRRS